MTTLKIGDVISISIDSLGLTRHSGICVDFDPFTGEPIIAHNSAKYGGVKEERLSEFIGEKKPSIRTRQTAFTAVEIQNRFRQKLGKPYNLLSYNCEDFVSEVLGLNESSPQRVFWSVVIVAGLLYVATRKSAA